MKFVPLRTVGVASPGVEFTRLLGETLGRILTPGDVVALQGELGAGKTNFVQGLAHGLNITEDVNSPTFILANEYPGGRLPLYHVDAYRVEDANEALGFGLEDYLDGEGVTVIEWADRVQDALPQDLLWVELEYVSEHERQLRISAFGPHAADLLTRWDPAHTPQPLPH